MGGFLRSLDIGPEGKGYIFRIRIFDKYGSKQSQIGAQGGTCAIRVGTAPLYVDSGEGIGRYSLGLINGLLGFMAPWEVESEPLSGLGE